MDVYDSMMGNIIDLNTTQDIPFFQHLSSIFCTLYTLLVATGWSGYDMASSIPNDLRLGLVV